MSSSIMRYKADYRTLAFMATYFVVAYSSFIYFDTVLANYGWGAIALWSASTCVMAFVMAVTVHNTIHCPVFYKKSHNKLFQYVLSLAYGYSVSAYVPGHNFSHHKETQNAKDAMRTSKARFKWHLLNQLFFFFLVVGAIMESEKKWNAKMKVEKPAWYAQWRAEMILVHGVKIAALFINPWAAVIFLWLPHIYGTWGIVSTNVWQHDGCDENHKYNHSRTFTGKILNFITMNNGYHGAHHDRPSLHWSLLPAYHNKNIEPHIHPNLSLNNFPAYLFQTYIYPGKRLQYDGSPYILADAVPDEDWVADIFLNDRRHAYDLGAEASTVEEILQTDDVSRNNEVEIH
jgi:fatty acid desaturase